MKWRGRFAYETDGDCYGLLALCSFCMGSRRLYDYVHNNPLFEFRPCHYVNDPYVIAQNDRMVSINSALTVDLTGQVCSDSLGFEFYSGIGGQVDFVRGSAMSFRGKSIMVLPSTTEDGKISRIVPYHSPGSGVVVTRGDIHYVVTEYGIAYVHGKSIRDRAMMLINIAIPTLDDELLAAAKKTGLHLQRSGIAGGFVSETIRSQLGGQEEYADIFPSGEGNG